MARNRDWEAKGIAIGNVDSGKLAANKNAQVEGDGERSTKMRGAVILRFLRPFLDCAAKSIRLHGPIG